VSSAAVLVQARLILLVSSRIAYRIFLTRDELLRTVGRKYLERDLHFGVVVDEAVVVVSRLETDGG
jgi:hypothetical protein